jgi:hypothetical protein
VKREKGKKLTISLPKFILILVLQEVYCSLINFSRATIIKGGQRRPFLTQFKSW